MLLIEALEKGEFKPYGKPDRVMDMLLSKVFFFGDKAIKVYKHTKAFYGDLSNPSFRKGFYEEDFFWNHAMSPDIYLRLTYVNQGGIEDFYIEMKKIDDSKTLTNLLGAGTVTFKDVESLTHFLIEKLRSLTLARKEKLKKYFDMGWYGLQFEDMEDMRQWVYMADAYIARKFTDEIIDLLKGKISKELYFTDYDPSFLSVAIDNNTDNLLILDGKPRAMDVMTPKDNWKVSDEYFNIVRLAVDAEVLGSKELGEAVYQTYFKNYRPEPAKTATLIYEIRCALIQWPYRHNIGQHDLAERFKTFALEKIEALKTLC
jgi:aminoglycoside phosphotransferase family enzyme